MPLQPENKPQSAAVECVWKVEDKDGGSYARLDGLSDLTTHNPAPNSSPVREPTGTYRIFKLG